MIFFKSSYGKASAQGMGKRHTSNESKGDCWKEEAHTGSAAHRHRLPAKRHARRAGYLEIRMHSRNLNVLKKPDNANTIP